MSAISEAASAPQPVRRPMWRRLFGFNLLTAVILGVGGYYLGWWIGHLINGPSFEYESATDENDVALLLAYVFGVVGFLIGLGFANYPVSRLLGRPASLREKESEGIGRYFGLCTDHKVVGMQYLVGIGVFFFVGGLNAMLIRAELLQPVPTFVGPNQYLSLVGMHGTMMMGMMTSGILGPFANYFVPMMIGSRRMAFPRIESLTFWLLMAAGFILVSTIFFGGFPTGWTGYAPLNEQAVMGMDSYIVFFALVGISMCLLGLNMMATIITMRAPGHDVVAPADLRVVGVRHLDPDGARGADADRGARDGGARPHDRHLVLRRRRWRQLIPVPEPVLVLRASGGVRTRAARLRHRARAAAGVHPQAAVGLPAGGFGHARRHAAELLRVAAPPVRQRHQCRSAPVLHALDRDHLDSDGLHLPVRAGHPVERRGSRFSVPMLFVLAWVFNFLIGGLSGVVLSDVPTDVGLHGSFFVMAHFHYTIMGGLIFSFFAAIYYWVPKMTGLRFNEMLAKWHFWLMFIFFNSTFLPLFALGLKGMPRRVSTYEPSLQGLNVWVSISAFVLGFSMLIFLFNDGLLADLRARAGRGEPVAFEVDRVAAAHADPRQQLRADPRVRLRSLRLRHAAAARRRRPAGDGGSLNDGLAERRAAVGADGAAGAGGGRDPAGATGCRRAGAVGRRTNAVRSLDVLLPGVPVRVLLPALDRHRDMFHPAHIKPDQALGAAFIACVVLSAAAAVIAGRR